MDAKPMDDRRVLTKYMQKTDQFCLLYSANQVFMTLSLVKQTIQEQQIALDYDFIAEQLLDGYAVVFSSKGKSLGHRDISADNQ
jgi:hypothetical protein